MMRRALVILALGALARCGGGADGDAFAVSELRNPDAEEAAFVRLLNNYRASQGLAPVTATPLLNQVAYDHSLAMGTQRFFSHNDPSGGTPFTRMAAAGTPTASPRTSPPATPAPRARFNSGAPPRAQHQHAERPRAGHRHRPGLRRQQPVSVLLDQRLRLRRRQLRHARRGEPSLRQRRGRARRGRGRARQRPGGA
ncbi:MAG: hypothetical protein IPF99_33620 [Deltaproteobacteria bacterium]|nr:hypothetical protein [Deltaproteobacteria bacterium]